MCPQKKLHNYCFNEHFTTGNYREGEDEREEKSQLAARASHNYNRINYYIRPHQDANWFFLYRGSSTTTGEVKLNYIYRRFFRKLNFTAM